MRLSSTVQLLLVFALAFSLASLAGPLAGALHLPDVTLANANIQTCQTRGASGACSEFWYPAGPSMSTEQAIIFTDGPTEFSTLQSASPSIDLTDWPLSPSLVASMTTNPNLLVTAPISSHGYFEIQFMLANNFWGVNMNYGNGAAGQNIRQGISHMLDKAQFVNSDPNIGGSGSAIDNPVPPSNGGLPSANPCAWDSANPESGSQCVVGTVGGTAYHLAAATTCSPAAPSPWMPCPGSPDLNAACQHFVAAGIATSCNSSSVLQSISASASAAGHVPTFFIRSDDLARLDLGNSLAAQICWIFTGAYTTPCTYLNTIRGPITAFPGFQTSPTTVSLDWWMYTAGYLGIYPFDQSLYFAYNSQFVSASCSSPGTASCSTQVAGGGTCSNASVSSSSAGDYMYLCNTAYDSISNQLEFAPCLSATGDPAPGQTNNGPGGNCPTTTKLSAISAGVQAENTYGTNAYTIPVFATSQQYAYLNNWSRVVNNDGSGVPNPFTWLNAYSANPAVSGTIRQGFAESTKSLNPYIASTVWDFYIVGNIYDSLGAANPLSNGQLLNWMSVAVSQLPNSALGYSPPSGTVSTYRITLRNDMFWQDGRKVTPWDVKFSYLTLLATGAFQGGQLSPLTGVTVVSTTQVDLNIKAFGPFTELSLTSPTVIPGRYWSVCSGSLWDGDVSTNNVPDTCMQADPNKITASYDPLSNGILIGSGPWMCRSSTGIVGTGCSSTGTMNPPPGGSYTLTRFGYGLAPASSISGIYFRSAGNLALWFWSQDNGDLTHDFLNFSVVAACFGSAPLPLGTTTGCGHFQQGIGANGGPIAVGLNQVAIVSRFVGVNWVSPFNWALSPPVGIAPLAPVLYESGVTLNPASVAGCAVAYPAGGYDC